MAPSLNIDITKFISPRATNRKHIAFMIRAQGVTKMRLEGLAIDVTLEAKDGSRFRAHAAVLSAYSPVLKSILQARAEGKVSDGVPLVLDEMTIEGLTLFMVLPYLMPVAQDTVIMNGLESAVVAHFDELVAARIKFKVPESRR